MRPDAALNADRVPGEAPRPAGREVPEPELEVAWLAGVRHVREEPKIVREADEVLAHGRRRREVVGHPAVRGHGVQVVALAATRVPLEDQTRAIPRPGGSGDRLVAEGHLDRPAALRRHRPDLPASRHVGREGDRAPVGSEAHGGVAADVHELVHAVHRRSGPSGARDRVVRGGRGTHVASRRACAHHGQREQEGNASGHVTSSGPRSSARRQQISPQIPVPGRDPHARPRIAQRLVLEPPWVEAHRAAPLLESSAVTAHQVGHGTLVEDETVQPQPAIQRVGEAVTPARKLPPGHLAAGRRRERTTAKLGLGCGGGDAAGALPDRSAL